MKFVFVFDLFKYSYWYEAKILYYDFLHYSLEQKYNKQLCQN